MDKKKVGILGAIALIIIAIVGFLIFNNKKVDLKMEVVDMNAPISQVVDKFIKDNENEAGLHSVKDGEYTYAMIVSEKAKASEMFINLYDVYKKGFNVCVEYNVEINKNTINDSNPERVQKMLIRFKEDKKVKPVIVNNEEKK